jgi:hypothetical protein
LKTLFSERAVVPQLAIMAAASGSAAHSGDENDLSRYAAAVLQAGVCVTGAVRSGSGWTARTSRST